jgi:Cytochrome c oxidase assembly protein CtaG/Cox11
LLYGVERAVDMQDPMAVIRSYVRATYARDFAAAYRLISAEDRKVRDLNRYVQQRGAYGGFVLEAAKKLGEFIELQDLKTQASPSRVQMLIKYRVPDPQKIAPLVLNWNPQRLNSLSAAERKTILDTLDNKKREGSLPMTEGEESFELVRDADEWRVFLDWAAGVKIPLRLDLSKSADLAVTLSQQEFTLQPGELFEIKLKITNHGGQPITARIGHLVEPASIADYLDFVQCGFLLPITLQPGKEQEYSGTYMLRGSLPEGVRQLSLTYDFRLLK